MKMDCNEKGIEKTWKVIKKGGIAIFESMDDFIKVHIGPHPANNTIITFQDGEQLKFGDKNKDEENDENV